MCLSFFFILVFSPLIFCSFLSFFSNHELNFNIRKRMDGSCVDGKYWGLSKYMQVLFVCYSSFSFANPSFSPSFPLSFLPSPSPLFFLYSAPSHRYTSLAMRDGPTSTFDNTWHYVADQNWREKIKSPLSMGQMINNSSSGDPNVTYVN